MWNIPARNPAFTGRDDLLAAVQARLQTGRAAVVQALHGMGGVGKTQLAAEYAHRFASSYDLTWWIDAEQDGLIGDQVVGLGLVLGCVPAGSGTETARAAVLAELRQRDRWLLIFDNAQAPADVAPWLPGGGGHALITSRQHGWDEVATPIEVDVLTRAESIELLRRRVPGLTETDANQLATELGDLPLAIAQTAGFIADTGTLASQYLGLLQTRAGQLLDQGAPGSYPRSLAAATALIADRLSGYDPAAAELASLCAFLARSRFLSTCSPAPAACCLASLRRGLPTRWPGGRPSPTCRDSLWLASITAGCRCTGSPRPSSATGSPRPAPPPLAGAPRRCWRPAILATRPIPAPGPGGRS